MFQKSYYLLLLILLLALKSGWAIAMILHGDLHLVPDEAQYWLWSQNLDWGYYSKPVGIALQIKMGTLLFGNSELGVRFGSVMISYLSGLALFFLSRSCSLSVKSSFWAAIIMALSPMGMVGSLFATTDWGLMLFWILSCILIVKAIRLQTKPNFWLIGGCILLGALFKWTMYVMWIPIGIYCCYQREWMGKKLFIGIAISLLALIPSIIWNAEHDWVTFKHVWTQSTGGEGSERSWNGNPLSFLGAQFALLSPLYFILFCIGIPLLFKKNIPQPIRFCGLLCTGLIAFYWGLSFFSKMQGNWAIYAYPSGVIFLSWFCLMRLKHGLKWLKGGIIFSLAIVFAIFSLPSLQSKTEGLLQIPYKMNPFRPNLGWNRLPDILREIDYQPQEQFLLADKYQTSSLLSFYSPEQKRAFFLNIFGRRKNQFSFWPSLDASEVGKSGYFIALEEHLRTDEQFKQIRENYQKKLKPFFNEVQFAGFKELFQAYGKTEKWAMIFYCKVYNGLLPLDVNKY